MGVDKQPYPYDDQSIYNKVANAADNVTTVNYTDNTKTVVSSVVQTSVTVGKTVTETFNGAGATTLVITRVVA